ncbi:unnamed protein product [Cladocopium goreaui]|uniref:SET domain-containing protein n=1 Tax=Cladocopium goreaui TaxID=2562237 RepID=A0A9P1DEX7_9DINO|nr:unnamed protein product [Cladocopium goreaui]
MNIHVPKVLVNSPKSSTKKKPATQAWEEAQKRPPPIVQAAKAKAQRSPTWLGEAGHPSSQFGDAGEKSVQVVPDSVPGASKANFSRIYAREEWDGEALSGLGSREETTREFRSFLEEFLQQRKITSVVDAGCGHWPSGYQRFMHWQNVRYTGVDVVPYVVQENANYFEDSGPTHFLLMAMLGYVGTKLSGFMLRSAKFICDDAWVPWVPGKVSNSLPEADLLLVKDVLMHLPNRAVHDFLAKSVNAKSPRYRAVMLVQNAIPPVAIREMVDIQPGQLLPFDITFPPFKAPFETVLRWQSDEPKAAGFS